MRVLLLKFSDQVLRSLAAPQLFYLAQVPAYFLVVASIRAGFRSLPDQRLVKVRANKKSMLEN
jgi:hypothetical protein